jgi:predicted ATP-grasp superfamily ATP-dependent carboligase
VLGGLRALHDAGHEVALAVTPRGSYGARSRLRAGLVRLPDPEVAPDRYVAALADAARRLGVRAVLPGTELALLALAGRDAQFPDGVALGVPDAETVRRALDKTALDELCAATGLETPQSRIVDRDEIDRGVPGPYPAIVKVPAGEDRAAGSVRCRRVDGPDDLRAAASRLPGDRLMVQRFVDGRLAAYAGVAWEGEIVCAASQIAARIYPPHGGITSFGSTVPADPALERDMARLVAGTGWSGIFQVQYLVASGGRRYVIDLNPRMYGSLALVIAAGLNLPAIWVELLLGHRPRVDGYRAGVRFRSEERDLGAFAVALTDRRWREAAAALVPSRGTVHAVFDRRDPLPFLRSIRQLGKGPSLLLHGHRR